MIEKLPQLKLLITTGMRNASIDVAAAKARGVVVCGTPAVGSPTSGIAIGLMLELTRRIGYENARMKAGVPWQTTIGLDLEGMTFHWYTDAFHDQLLHAALVNSIVVACIVAPICLVLGTLTAFGLTRFRFRARPAVSGDTLIVPALLNVGLDTLSVPIALLEFQLNVAPLELVKIAPLLSETEFVPAE